MLELMRAMRPADEDEWTKPDEEYFENTDWTEECQGVTHDGEHWYLSSNHQGKRRVYRLSTTFQVLGWVELENIDSRHLGDIDYHDGRIYCAMEPIKVVVIATPQFTDWWEAPLVGADGGAPPQVGCPWCAVHPWSGLLYSSNFGHAGRNEPEVSVLRAYRREDVPGSRPGSQQFRHAPDADIHLSARPQCAGWCLLELRPCCPGI